VVNGRGFETFDISDPANALPLGSYTSKGWSSALAVDKGIGYLTAGDELQIVDVSDPAAPTLIRGLSFGEHLFGVAYRDGLALVNGLSSYLYTVDVTVPSSPSVKGSLTGGTGFDVAVSGDRALVAAGAEGLLVVNVSAASSPTLEGFYDTSGTAQAVAGDGTTVYLATQEAQHWVFGCDTCFAPCSVDAVARTHTPDVCAGTKVELEGETSTSSGCPGGKLLYQWYEDGAPIPGATDPNYTVPDTHPAGNPLFWLEVRCELDHECLDWAWVDVLLRSDSWPTIAPTSLRVAKTASDHTLTWAIESGTGETNVHRSLDPSLLSLTGPDPATLADFTDTTGYTSSYNVPGEGVAFYRLFGRMACTGGSAPP
jgi:hypothetical protein